jgi:purine-binding chemotaxis protein CheW
MSNNLLVASASQALVATSSGAEMYVTMVTAGQLFGISVLQVQDVLGPQRITRVPLAPPEVAGSLNLRGRIVTAIDMRIRLGLPQRPENETGMSVVVDLRGELYSLIVDKVGEVMSLPQTDYEANPATLEPHWQEVSQGIYRLKDCLLIILDVPRLLRQAESYAA